MHPHHLEAFVFHKAALSGVVAVVIGCPCVLIVGFYSTNCRINSNFEARMTKEHMIRLNKFTKP
jgi:hypothetical protein